MLKGCSMDAECILNTLSLQINFTFNSKKKFSVAGPRIELGTS